MDFALAGARLLLAAVFVVAGAVKLRDRPGTRQALADLGAPATLVGPLAPALPLAELAVAALLLPTATAWWGAIGALGLLALFTAAILASLARGRRPACRCFGQLSAAPVGPGTVVRNLILLAVAASIVWSGPLAPGPSLVGWLDGLTVAERVGLVVGVVGVALLGLTAALLVQVLGAQGRLLLRLDALERGLAASGAFVAPDRDPAAGHGHAPGHEHAGHEHPGHAQARDHAPAGLAVGSPAPDVRLRDPAGTEVTLAHLLDRGLPVLLAFTDPSCGPCRALRPDLERWQRDLADRLTVVAVAEEATEGRGQEPRGDGVGDRAGAPAEASTVLLERGYAASNAFGVFGTPAAVLVRSDGTIGSLPAAGPEAIRGLVERTVGAAGESGWAGLTPLPVIDGRANGWPRPAFGRSEHGDSEHGGSVGAGLAIGASLPSFALPDLDGRFVGLGDPGGRPTLLLLWSPSCGFCRQILPELRTWLAGRPAAGPELVAVASGTAEENRAVGPGEPVLLDPTFAVGAALGATGTPSAVLVDADGRIASELAVGGPAVLALVRAVSSRGCPDEGARLAHRRDTIQDGGT